MIVQPPLAVPDSDGVIAPAAVDSRCFTCAVTPVTVAPAGSALPAQPLASVIERVVVPALANLATAPVLLLVRASAERQNGVEARAEPVGIVAHGLPAVGVGAFGVTQPVTVPESPAVSHDSPWTTWSCTTGALEPGGIGDCAIE